MSVTCPHCSKDVKGWIPEDRLSEMAKGKREATTQAEALAAEMEGLKGKATQVDTLAAELAEVRAHADGLTKAHGQQVAVYRHGITDADDVADIMAIYQRRAPDGVDLGAWLSSDSLPRSVSALMGPSAAASVPAVSNGADLGTVAAPATEATPVATATAPATNGAATQPAAISPPAPNGVPTANAGAVPTPPATALPSAQDIASMSTEQYKAHRDQLLASLTARR